MSNLKDWIWPSTAAFGAALAAVGAGMKKKSNSDLAAELEGLRHANTLIEAPAETAEKIERAVDSGDKGMATAALGVVMAGSFVAGAWVEKSRKKADTPEAKPQKS